VCIRYKEKGRRRRMYVTNGTKIEEERKGVGVKYILVFAKK
jgi:hypothetical protein